MGVQSRVHKTCHPSSDLNHKFLNVPHLSALWFQFFFYTKHYILWNIYQHIISPWRLWSKGVPNLNNLSPDPEKQKKFTQSKFYIFFLHKPFSGFYKGNWGKMKKFTRIWKNLHKYGFQVCMFFQVCLSPISISKFALKFIFDNTLSNWFNSMANLVIFNFLCVSLH